VQLADPQLGMLHWDRDWTEELTMLRLAVQHVNRLRPRFLLISGDLINAFPTSEHEAVGARQVASFKEALHELNPSIPVILQPGNHDIGQRPTTADIDRYRARFGDDYYSFWVGGVMYISLNSQYYREADEVLPLAQAHDEWASAAFCEAVERGARHVVVLSHVPPFISEEDEQAGWANWKHEPRRRLLGWASDAHAKLWLAGHYHGNAVGTSRSGIEVVTTSSCGGVINWNLEPSRIATQPFPDFKKVVGSPPVVADARHSGMRIVRVTESGFTHRWFELAQVPPSLDDAFASRAHWSTVKERFQLADVMGLTSANSFMKRKSSMNVMLPQRSRSMCTAADVEAIRKARKQHPSSAAEAALTRAESAAIPGDAPPESSPSAVQLARVGSTDSLGRAHADGAGEEGAGAGEGAAEAATERRTPKRLLGADSLLTSSGAATAAQTAAGDRNQLERRSSGVAETVRAFESRARGESIDGADGSDATN